MLENIPLAKIRILDFVKAWKTVSITLFIYICDIAYFAKDRICNDIHSGVFGVCDGHGGKHVADHITERIPEELKKEMIKNPNGDLSQAIETVFLRVIIFLMQY